MVLTAQTLFCQEPPPRPIEITVTGQSLCFGAFTQGNSGGSVTVTAAGLRSWGGDVVLLNLSISFSPALFLVTGDPGTLVTIQFGDDTSLTRVGGGSMNLEIGDSDPSGYFVIATTPPASTELKVGGILTVGNATNNPPGSYSGTFDIILIQE